jgi:hypothetical protein
VGAVALITNVDIFIGLLNECCCKMKGFVLKKFGILKGFSYFCKQNEKEFKTEPSSLLQMNIGASGILYKK